MAPILFTKHEVRLIPNRENAAPIIVPAGSRIQISATRGEWFEFYMNEYKILSCKNNAGVDQYKIKVELIEME